MDYLLNFFIGICATVGFAVIVYSIKQRFWPDEDPGLEKFRRMIRRIEGRKDVIITEERTKSMDDPIAIKLSKFADLKEAEKRQIFSLPPPKKCDLCSSGLSEKTYYIDGKLKNSDGWANMCPKCFFENGAGIGWGEGQLYMQNKKGAWLMVAGFSPSDEEDDPVCNFCGENFQKNELVEIKDGEWACQNCIKEAESIMGSWQDQQEEGNS